MREGLFFNPEIDLGLEWKGNLRLRVGSVRPHNKKQISEGLRDMSPESIRNRFLGSKRDFSERELQYLTHLDGWNHYAIGIEEQNNQKGVGIIRLVRSSHDEKEAEIAITIIDEYQKKGLGFLMLNLIALAAKERNIERLSFTFLPHNDAIVKLVTKAGPAVKELHGRDYFQLYLDLSKIEVEEIKSRLVKILPAIETFHLKT